MTTLTVRVTARAGETFDAELMSRSVGTDLPLRLGDAIFSTCHVTAIEVEAGGATALVTFDTDDGTFLEFLDTEVTKLRGIIVDARRALGCEVPYKPHDALYLPLDSPGA